MTVCHNVARRILGGKLDIFQQGLMCIKVPYSVNFQSLLKDSHITA